MQPIMARVIFAIVVMVSLFYQPERPDAAIRDPQTTDHFDEGTTPLQKALLHSIAQRRSRGLPVPAGITYESDTVVSVPATRVAGTLPAPMTISATTILRFDGPAQAGLSRWPDLADGRLGDADARIDGTQYTDPIKWRIQQKDPYFWQRHPFGSEPRTYTFRETYTTTCLGDIADAPVLQSTSTTLQEFLMGFTIPAPDISCKVDCSIEKCIEIAGEEVACLHVGLELDYVFGLRLPMEISFTSESPMKEGSTYTPTTSARGLDWSAADYTDAGLGDLAEDGNEFAIRFHFFGGASLTILGEEVSPIPPVTLDLPPTYSRSFTTPLGGSFNLPDIKFKLLGDDASLGVGEASYEFGLRLTPSLGSDKFTADWTVTGEASGSGNLTYTAAGVPLDVGPVCAIDGPGAANFVLDDLRYHFTQIEITPQLYLELCAEAEIIGGDCINFAIDMPGIDLATFIQGLSVGTHDGTPGAFNTSIPIENVAPTAAIDRTGTVLVQGVPTFIIEVGQQLTFNGRATDPGRDDLRLEWDWDDGAPSPDIATTYPVPAGATCPVNRDVSESQSHTFDYSCLYDVAFGAVDDDLATGQDHVPVLVVANVLRRARLEGYWQHQFSEHGKRDFDDAALVCLLKIVGHVSAVFNELRDASTIENAYDVLQLQQNHGSAIEQMDRELLVTWLNFAAGVFSYMELIDTDGDGTADTPFAAVVGVGESVRSSPTATTAEVRRHTRLLHHLNTGRVGTLPGLTAASHGFNPNGTGLDPFASRFALIVRSGEDDMMDAGGIRAGRPSFKPVLIDPTTAYVSDGSWLLAPDAWALFDQDGDKVPDLVLVYSSVRAQRLFDFSGRGGTTIALQYEMKGKGSVVVPNVLGLGPPVPLGIPLPEPLPALVDTEPEPQVQAPEPVTVREVPRVTKLATIHPNPFRSRATVDLDLAKAGRAQVEVFNLQGVRVRGLAKGWFPAGGHTLVWDGRDDTGREVPTGVYMVRFMTNDVVGSRKLVRLD